MEKIELIRAEEKDLDEIWALCELVREKTPSSGWDEHYPTRSILQSDIASESLYKIVLDGKIVSIMQIRSWEAFMKGEEADDHQDWNPQITNPCALGRFCVSPNCQGQGLGRRIMQATLEKARSMGYDGARFHTLATNGIATHLYESMGFRTAGRVAEYGMEFYCHEMKL